MHTTCVQFISTSICHPINTPPPPTGPNKRHQPWPKGSEFHNLGTVQLCFHSNSEFKEHENIRRSCWKLRNEYNFPEKKEGTSQKVKIYFTSLSAGRYVKLLRKST